MPVNPDRLLLHPLLQTVRGMCTDEDLHVQIDAVVARAVERAKDLEEGRDRLRWRLLSVERALFEVPDHHDISAGALEFIQRALDEETR